MDRVDVQAAGGDDVAGLVGIRFQYIPEFDDAYKPSKASQILSDKADLIEDVMAEIGELDGVTYADLVFFDTKVYKNTDRPGTEYINGGTSLPTELLGDQGWRASCKGRAAGRPFLTKQLRRQIAAR